MKAKERIETYGVEAYLKMRGLKTTPELISYYTEKYVEAPLAIPSPTKGRISRQMKEYWADVKAVVEGRKLDMRGTRALMKKEARGKRIKLRITKIGEGWQLVILGRFKDEKTGEEKEEEGYSYTHVTKDWDVCYDEAIKKAQWTLGGSNWKIIKLLDYNWNRFYGREAGISENET